MPFSVPEATLQSRVGLDSSRSYEAAGVTRMYHNHDRSWGSHRPFPALRSFVTLLGQTENSRLQLACGVVSRLALAVSAS